MIRRHKPGNPDPAGTDTHGVGPLVDARHSNLDGQKAPAPKLGCSVSRRPPRSPVPADAPRQVFRPSPPNYVLGWVVTTFFVLFGLLFVLGGLGGGDWVGSEIMGVVLLLLAAFGIRAMATSVLIATPAELVYWWNWTRRRSVDWTEIQSFSVGPGRNRGGWPAVIITLNAGTRIRTEVSAYRRSYPARISAELTALQRQYAPAPPSSGSDQSTVRTMGAFSVLALVGIRIAQSIRRSRLPKPS
jgi:hypothetical protein